MDNRPNLQKLLEELMGNRNVYFQPPPSLRILYPAIVYSRSNIENSYADNSPYKQGVAYKLVVVDKNPDSAIVKKVSKLPMCKFNINYVSDNLIHLVFKIYYYL